MLPVLFKTMQMIYDVKCGGKQEKLSSKSTTVEICELSVEENLYLFLLIHKSWNLIISCDL